MTRDPLSPQDAAALKVYRQLQRALTGLVQHPLAQEMGDDQRKPTVAAELVPHALADGSDPRAPRGIVAAVVFCMDKLEELHPAIKTRSR